MGTAMKLADFLGTDRSLPEGFRDLEPFVDYWCRATNDERWIQRASAEMPQIQAFYDAMLARAEDVLAYLERYPLGNAPPDATRLAQLLLALGHAAIAVEMHGQPRAHYSPWPNMIHVKKGPWPYG